MSRRKASGGIALALYVLGLWQALWPPPKPESFRNVDSLSCRNSISEVLRRDGICLEAAERRVVSAIVWFLLAAPAVVVYLASPSTARTPSPDA